ncbi:outer membrane protein H.8 [Parapedobacter pyrenivorans]|uniref:Outer membrane protein H.8 n=1 Tax=Parapedobacter pyrenivorans TaxID=1305674 RepID=A0A917M8V1_9SPHI|nr:azurin [Parapedobacter pyrenivorans]GGG86603.1 outer membrane protein H.8 [Parapedobacter pyrenivorans]
MKKIFLVPVVAGAVFIAACGGNQKSEESTETAAATTEQQAPAVDIPGLEDVAVSNEVALEGNDLMQYNKTLFRVKAGQPIKLTFKNAGEMPKESMGHNVVVVQPGTDLPALGGEAIKAVDTEYIPVTFASSIIAHTKLLGPGETDAIEFTLEEKGVYPFLCSFPGHYGVMQGKIVAE